MPHLGLGKTLFNSSVCYMTDDENLEILLTERLTRKKGSGLWPTTALKELASRYDLSTAGIVENRDVEDPARIETAMNLQFPFFDYLKANNLEKFSRHFNSEIRFATHHAAHACAAAFMSPFEKTLILVIDGAGSRVNFFSPEHPERNLLGISPDAAEERSLYFLNNGTITCAEKKMQVFSKSARYPSHFFSQGLGTFYEKASEFVFNSKRSAGKVMGLAALGRATKVTDSKSYFENLNWAHQYKGNSKKEWEESPNFQMYCNLSADVQSYFEEDYIGYIKKLKQTYPEYTNLIIAGGCALNCTSNMKLFNLGLFENIYIPPFPGDESIGLGTAYMSYLNANNSWRANPYEKQHGYFGPLTSVPTDDAVIREFAGYEIVKPPSITEFTADLLAEGHILGWFQGRSESGPRALGNRSILCRPDKPGVKDQLNKQIKFRESFRPYGCSTLHEKSHRYFEVPENFENPYMSFATKVRADFRMPLGEVSHVDGTSRMQTVRVTQNKLFHELILKFGNKTDLYVLLNTSLNVMGEPIVESLADARNFLDKVPVYGLAVGEFFVRRK